MKTGYFIVILLLIGFISLSMSFHTDKELEVPVNGYVPDEETAIKIAEAVIVPIHGKRILSNERPFVAELKYNSIWVVHGTLKKGRVGGVTYVEIQKSDGKILDVYGTK